MEAIEKHYRDNPRNPIAVRQYVQSLLDSGHVLEAAHFFEKLKKMKPHSASTSKLGYLICIKRLDPRVQAYDLALKNAGVNDEEIYSLRLAYYLAFNDMPHAIEAAAHLSKLVINNKFTMDLIIQAIEDSRSELLARVFFENQIKRITPSAPLERIFKKILLDAISRILRQINESKK